MIVKLNTSLAGPGCSRDFMPRMIVKMSDATGARYIESGAAELAPEGATPEGELFDQIAEERIKEEPVPTLERATAATAETPESGRAGKCTGTTSKGNPCGRVALPGTDRCKEHPKD